MARRKDRRSAAALVGVRKIIHGSRGATKLWRLPSLPFRIDGCLLLYDRPLGGFVDELEPLGEGYAGRAMPYRRRDVV